MQIRIKTLSLIILIVLSPGITALAENPKRVNPIYVGIVNQKGTLCPLAKYEDDNWKRLRASPSQMTSEQYGAMFLKESEWMCYPVYNFLLKVPIKISEPYKFKMSDDEEYWEFRVTPSPVWPAKKKQSDEGVALCPDHELFSEQILDKDSPEYKQFYQILLNKFDETEGNGKSDKVENTRRGKLLPPSTREERKKAACEINIYKINLPGSNSFAIRFYSQRIYKSEGVDGHTLTRFIGWLIQDSHQQWELKNEQMWLSDQFEYGMGGYSTLGYFHLGEKTFVVLCAYGWENYDYEIDEIQNGEIEKMVDGGGNGV